MKFKKTWAKWLFGFVCLGSIGYIIWSTNSESNAPAVANVTASASGTASTSQAAGRDINNGVPPSTLQQVLNLKDVELSERIQAEYPHGCVLLGLENGKVVYDSRLKDIQIKSDWEQCKISIDLTSKMCQLTLPPSLIFIDPTNNSTFTMNGGILHFPYTANKPNYTGITFFDAFVCEVLDVDRGIFIVGFMPEEFLR